MKLKSKQMLMGRGKIAYRNLLTAFLSLVLITSSCTDKEGSIPISGTPLQVTVSNDLLQSRTVVEGNTLPADAIMGVSVVAADGSAYPTGVYTNLKYTTTDGTTFDTTSKPMLTSDEAKAVSYYPYSSTVSDMTAIPVTTAEQKDYMYSGWCSGLDASNPVAKFEMKHALAAIRLVLKKDAACTSSATLTSVSAESEAFYASASLDATTGSLSSLSGAGAVIGQSSLSETLSTSETTFDFIVIPGLTKGEITFTVTIDGDEYKASASSVTLEQGAIHIFELDYIGTALEFNGVSIKEWVVKQSSGNFVDEFKDALVAVYDVTDASSATTLLYNSSSVSYIDRMMVNGVEVTPAQSYQFENAGRYNVKYMLKDKSTIPDNFMNGISTLVDVIIPENITNIGNYAFKSTNLQNILIIPNSVSTIGSYAFSDCISIPDIILSDKLQKINDYTFQNCKKLKGIDIPDAVKSVGNYAFDGCNKLSKLRVGDGCESLGECAFQNTYISSYSSSPVYFGKSLKTIKKYCFSYSLNPWSGGFYGDIILNEGLETIETGAFYNNSINHIYIPKSVNNIHYYALTCDNIETIVVHDENPVYDSRDNCNCIIETASNKVIRGCRGTSIIPEGIEIIGQYAFAYMAGTNNMLVLPSTLKEIENWAFFDNWKMNNAHIKCKSVVAPTIYERSFYMGSEASHGVSVYIPVGSSESYSSWMNTSNYYPGYYGWKLVETDM